MGMGVALVGVIVGMRVHHDKLLYYNITRVHQAGTIMAGRQNRRRLELRRQGDDMVYAFVRQVRPDGTVGYQRQDQDL